MKHVQSIGTELKATCAECAVEVYESPMSVTGMINVGTGAVTLGFAAEDYAFALPRGTAAETKGADLRRPSKAARTQARLSDAGAKWSAMADFGAARSSSHCALSPSLGQCALLVTSW